MLGGGKDGRRVTEGDNSSRKNISPTRGLSCVPDISMFSLLCYAITVPDACHLLRYFNIVLLRNLSVKRVDGTKLCYCRQRSGGSACVPLQSDSFIESFMEDGQRYDYNKAFDLGSASNITPHRFDDQPFTISGLDSMYHSNVRIVGQGSV